MADPDPATAKRVIEAMMAMGKIDIAGIETARWGRGEALLQRAAIEAGSDGEQDDGLLGPNSFFPVIACRMSVCAVACSRRRLRARSRGELVDFRY